MTGNWYGVLRFQGVMDGLVEGTMPTFIRTDGKPIAYGSETEAAAIAAMDRKRFKVCRISPEVERLYGVAVASCATSRGGADKPADGPAPDAVPSLAASLGR